MKIVSITRKYSRSINARQYGAPESWIKVESTYTAEVESADDPLKISSMLHEQAKKEVIDDISAIADKIRASMAPAAPATAAAPAVGQPRSL